MIPALKQVILRPDFPPRTKVVWTVLCLQAEETGSLPPLERLAELCGENIPVVRDGLRDLALAGHLGYVRPSARSWWGMCLYPFGDRPGPSEMGMDVPGMGGYTLAVILE